MPSTPPTARTFTVARNPDGESTLPYLIRLPLPGGDLVLKARDTWPRTAKVYCHRADGWPAAGDVEIVDEAPVRECVKRGVAIDLVLDRPRENRSQLVFARIAGGREAIFWQSPKTTKKARPSVRVPGRKASGLDDLVILVDTRERYAYSFSEQQAATERRALPAGDYGVEVDGEIVAVVERKSLEDLCRSLVDGRLGFAMAELATVDRAAVIVDDRYSQLFKQPFAPAGLLADSLGALQARYPSVPIVFGETRKLAEEWTFRYLGGVRALVEGERDRPL